MEGKSCAGGMHAARQWKAGLLLAVLELRGSALGFSFPPSQQPLCCGCSQGWGLAERTRLHCLPGQLLPLVGRRQKHVAGCTPKGSRLVEGGGHQKPAPFWGTEGLRTARSSSQTHGHRCLL